MNKCYIDQNLVYVNIKQNSLEENDFETQNIVPLQTKKEWIRRNIDDVGW